MTVMTPYPSSTSSRPEICGARTHNHIHKHYKQWRSNCFLHRYPEPACKCHFKTTSFPSPGESNGRQRASKHFFSYSALEDFGFKRKKDVGGGASGPGRLQDFLLNKKIRPLYAAHSRARLHLYTYIYISPYISRLPSCSYNFHVLFAIQGVAGLISAPQ